MHQRPFVCIVDDDDSVRESLSGFLRSAGYDVQVFSSAEEYLDDERLRAPQCLILDLCMPDMTGAECQEVLGKRGDTVPIIFISAKSDETLRAQLLRSGAIAYLTKPFADDALLSVLESAVQGRRNPNGT